MDYFLVLPDGKVSKFLNMKALVLHNSALKSTRLPLLDKERRLLYSYKEGDRAIKRLM